MLHSPVTLKNARGCAILAKYITFLIPNFRRYKGMSSVSLITGCMRGLTPRHIVTGTCHPRRSKIVISLCVMHSTREIFKGAPFLSADPCLVISVLFYFIFYVRAALECLVPNQRTREKEGGGYCMHIHHTRTHTGTHACTHITHTHTHTHTHTQTHTHRMHIAQTNSK